jgi:hypothetical protein
MTAEAAAARRRRVSRVRSFRELSDDELTGQAQSRTSLSGPHHEMEMQRRLKDSIEALTAETAKASAGQACVLRCDASRIGCASMLSRVSASPSRQMKSSRPGGGSGQTHQRPSIRFGLVMLPPGYTNGLSGSSA